MRPRRSVRTSGSDPMRAGLPSRLSRVKLFGTLALTPPLAVAIVAAVEAGLAFGPVNPIFATVTQESTAALPVGSRLRGPNCPRTGRHPDRSGPGGSRGAERWTNPDDSRDGRYLSRRNSRHVLQPGAPWDGRSPGTGIEPAAAKTAASSGSTTTRASPKTDIR